MPSNSRTDVGTWSSSSGVDQVVETELQIQVSSSKRLGPGILRHLDAHGCGSDLRSAGREEKKRSEITGFGTNLFLRHGPGVLTSIRPPCNDSHLMFISTLGNFNA